MENNKQYLNKREVKKYLIKEKLSSPYLVITDKHELNEFINNKFNDQGLFENEFKDLDLLTKVFDILCFQTFNRWDYFDALDIFNVLKPSSDIEKKIYLDIIRVVIRYHDLYVTKDNIINYYNCFNNKDLFYKSINILLSRLNKGENKHPNLYDGYIINFLISIRKDYINEEDYFSMCILLFTIYNKKNLKFEEEIIEKFDPNILTSKTSSLTYHYMIHYEFIKMIYELSNQEINKDYLIELKNKINILKDLEKSLSDTEETSKKIEDYIKYIDKLFMINTLKKEEPIDYKSKYEEIINSYEYKRFGDVYPYDLVLRNIMLNKNLLIIGNENQDFSNAIKSMASLLDKKYSEFYLKRFHSRVEFKRLYNNFLILHDIVYICINNYGNENNIQIIKIISDMFKNIKKNMINPNLILCIYCSDDIDLEVDLDFTKIYLNDLEQESVKKRTKNI